MNMYSLLIYNCQKTFAVARQSVEKCLPRLPRKYIKTEVINLQTQVKSLIHYHDTARLWLKKKKKKKKK